MPPRRLIGQVETVAFPEITNQAVKARIDTGARTSAIWVSKIYNDTQGLHVVFFGKGSKLFTGQEVIFEEYAQVVVVSSTGLSQKRFKVRLLIVVGGRKVRAWFTLADRSRQTYPVLVGRNILRGKFVVDVSKPAEKLQKRIRKPNKVASKARKAER